MLADRSRGRTRRRCAACPAHKQEPRQFGCRATPHTQQTLPGAPLGEPATLQRGSLVGICGSLRLEKLGLLILGPGAGPTPPTGQGSIRPLGLPPAVIGITKNRFWRTAMLTPRTKRPPLDLLPGALLANRSRWEKWPAQVEITLTGTNLLRHGGTIWRKDESTAPTAVALAVIAGAAATGELASKAFRERDSGLGFRLCTATLEVAAS
jgi:hypothetical protein